MKNSCCVYCRNCDTTFFNNLQFIHLNTFIKDLKNTCLNCNIACATCDLSKYLAKSFPNFNFSKADLNNIPHVYRAGVCSYVINLYSFED